MLHAVTQKPSHSEKVARLGRVRRCFQLGAASCPPLQTAGFPDRVCLSWLAVPCGQAVERLRQHHPGAPARDSGVPAGPQVQASGAGPGQPHPARARGDRGCSQSWNLCPLSPWQGARRLLGLHLADACALSPQASGRPCLSVFHVLSTFKDTSLAPAEQRLILPEVGVKKKAIYETRQGSSLYCPHVWGTATEDD